VVVDEVKAAEVVVEEAVVEEAAPVEETKVEVIEEAAPVQEETPAPVQEEAAIEEEAAPAAAVDETKPVDAASTTTEGDNVVAAGQYDGPTDGTSDVLEKTKEIDDLYTKLREASEARAKSLEAAVSGNKLKENLETELQWVKERDGAAKSKEYGKNQNDTQRLIKNHTALQSAIALHEETVVEVLNESGSSSDAQVKEKHAQLDAAWKALKTAADERTKALNDAQKSIQFYVSADEAEAFIKETEPAVTLTDVGGNEESSAALLKRHDSVEGEIESYEFNIKALRAKAQQLTDADHHDKANIAKRLAEIEALWTNLRAQSAQRKKALQQALDFHRFNRESEDLASWIGDREREAKDRDFALDAESLAALKKKHDALNRDLEANQPRLKVA